MRVVVACTRPSATRTLIAASGAHAGHRGDHVAVGVLEHGVPALQRGQRGQRPGAGALVGDVVLGAVEPVAEGTAGAVAQLVDLGGALVEQAARVGEHRPGAQRVEAGLLAGQPAAQHVAEPVPGGVDEPQLLGDVGDDQLGGVGGRGGADVGDQVEQRRVLLVADRGDDRRAELVDGADQRLVGERQQVLDRAAAAGDHDHVDVGVPLEPGQRLHHLGGRALGPASWRGRPRRRRWASGGARCRARRARRPTPGR